MSDPAPIHLEPQPRKSWLHTAIICLAVIALVYLLILSVGMVGGGFKIASGGKETVKGFLKTVGENPLLGLVLGILATSLVQSSSTVTSVIVGLVAGGMSVKAAIPMVMGANIGTTVTNTLVSMAHITRPQEFRRAFAAATVHDFFNFMAVAIFLSLEVLVRWLSQGRFGLLEVITGPIASFFIDPATGESATGGVNTKSFNFIKPITKPVIKAFWSYQESTGDDGGLIIKAGGLYGALGFGRIGGSLCLIFTGIAAIFTSIFVLGRILKANLTGRAERVFHLAVGRGPVTGIASGTIITVLVQSSSTTTSLIVPMAGTGVLRLKQVFPFTLGANIGTTVTALLASLAGADDPAKAQAALQIALVHTCFNVFATVLIYGVPFLRRIPLRASMSLGALAVKRRWLAILYVVCAFFLLPALLAGIVQGVRHLFP